MIFLMLLLISMNKKLVLIFNLAFDLKLVAQACLIIIEYDKQSGKEADPGK